MLALPEALSSACLQLPISSVLALPAALSACLQSAIFRFDPAANNDNVHCLVNDEPEEQPFMLRVGWWVGCWSKGGVLVIGWGVGQWVGLSSLSEAMASGQLSSGQLMVSG